MSPLRIVIELLFLYALYRLFIADRRRPTVRERPAQQRPPAYHDELVEDPVCHAYVPKQQAVVLQQGEVSHYFCSEHCREAFRAHQGEKA